MDRTGEYLAGPARQRAHLLPRGYSATVRLDLRRPDGMTRWYLTVSEHGISILPDGEREADFVLTADGEVFDRLVMGGDLVTAALRNDVTYVGSQRALFYFERLLPGPPDSHGPERVSGSRAGQHHVEGGQNGGF